MAKQRVVKTVEGPVIGSKYNISTISIIDDELRSISARGREWDRDRNLLLDARLILMLEQITGISST